MCIVVGICVYIEKEIGRFFLGAVCWEEDEDKEEDGWPSSFIGNCPACKAPSLVTGDYLLVLVLLLLYARYAGSASPKPAFRPHLLLLVRSFPQIGRDVSGVAPGQAGVDCGSQWNNTDGEWVLSDFLPGANYAGSQPATATSSFWRSLLTLFPLGRTTSHPR